MAYNRLYHFNSSNSITSFHDAELANDEAAVAFARSAHKGFRSELWNEGRRVATLDTGQVHDHGNNEPIVSFAP